MPLPARDPYPTSPGAPDLSVAAPPQHEQDLSALSAVAVPAELKLNRFEPLVLGALQAAHRVLRETAGSAPVERLRLGTAALQAHLDQACDGVSLKSVAGCSAAYPGAEVPLEWQGAIASAAAVFQGGENPHLEDYQVAGVLLHGAKGRPGRVLLAVRGLGCYELKSFQRGPGDARLERGVEGGSVECPRVLVERDNQFLERYRTPWLESGRFEPASYGSALLNYAALARGAADALLSSSRPERDPQPDFVSCCIGYAFAAEGAFEFGALSPYINVGRGAPGIFGQGAYAEVVAARSPKILEALRQALLSS